MSNATIKGYARHALQRDIAKVKESVNPPAVPAGMVVVTKKEFFAALYADKRDIMPTTEARDYTPWRIQSTRAMWGWASTGWASKFGMPTVYALANDRT